MFRHGDCKMWPYSYIRKTESVAELKMKFVGNQNVKNGIGVSDTPTRTPQTSTAVVRGAVSVNGIKRKIQIVNSKNVSFSHIILSFNFKY